MKNRIRLKSRSMPTDPADALLTGALPDRAQVARDRMEHQLEPALTEALSEREIAENRGLAERIRDYQRNEQLARIQEAEDMGERVRRTAAKLAEREAADLLRAGKALAEQRRAASPHAKIARLHRRKSLVLGILTAAVVFAMLFSAVTVQHNIVPDGGPANLMWWMAYGLEALISGMLIALMLSTSDTVEWNVIEDPRAVYAIEGVLLALTVGLNIYPYAKAGDWFQTGVHVIAPITVGTALATHSVVSRRYGAAIAAASAQAPAAEDLNARLLALTQISAGLHPAPLNGIAEHPAEQRSTHRPTEQIRSTVVAEHPQTALPSPVRSTEATEQPDDDGREQSTPASAAEHPGDTEPGEQSPESGDVAHHSVPVSGQVAEAFGAAKPEPSPASRSETVDIADPAPVADTGRMEQGSSAAEQAAPAPVAEQSSTAAERAAEQQLSAPVSAEHPTEQLPRQILEQQSTRRATEHVAEQPSAMGELASEVRRVTRSRLPIERIVEVLSQHDATGDGAARIARDLGMGFETVDRLLTAAAKIRADRGGRVIALRQS
ncbi:hypothetical protein [Nocardia sp. NPDC051570]|uniref:hypothetical protein n=1 Tax=Nocardia sp. NPDC051570 TaxID=3364324 RepID=UPI00378ABA15